MSSNKYANLPDIDTAPDVYETEDAFPVSLTNKGDSSDEESALVVRGLAKSLNSNREELDSSNLIGTEEATKKFKRSERRRERVKTHYAYPPSPNSPSSPTTPGNLYSVPLSHRLRALHAELSALEAELADPSNPLLAKEREEGNVDPGELIRGLVDVRGRLEKIRKGKEGRGKLVGAVLGENEASLEGLRDSADEKVRHNGDVSHSQERMQTGKPDVRTIVEMDKRVGELESIVGSSGTSLDETVPLPPPLLQLMTRLNNQLNLLTQPRHIDSVSRRLKLLLSDLDRASTAQSQAHRRQASQPSSSTNTANTALQEQIVPLLNRLGPTLPHIPHILTRLRTLSSLHSGAKEFQNTLEVLEEEQRKTREALDELESAVKTVETSLEENKAVVRDNVGGLEGRVDSLLRRLEEFSK